MARIDFAFGAPDRLRTACQVVRKQYLAGQRMVVFCTDPARLTAFDRMLWAFDDTSFVPHVLASDALAPQTPVVLTASPPQPVGVAAQAAAPDQPPPWLLNLDDNCPPGYDTFARILEIVSGDDADRQAARQRWRAYLADGHEPQSHAIGGKTGG
jgi:DNA polymerase-3 subunit chi